MEVTAVLFFRDTACSNLLKNEGQKEEEEGDEYKAVARQRTHHHCHTGSRAVVVANYAKARYKTHVTRVWCIDCHCSYFGQKNQVGQCTTESVGVSTSQSSCSFIDTTLETVELPLHHFSKVSKYSSVFWVVVVFYIWNGYWGVVKHTYWKFLQLLAAEPRP